MTMDETDKMEENLRALVDSKVRMNDREREFVTQCEERFDAEQSRMRMSTRQWNWLEAIVEKYS